MLLSTLLWVSAFQKVPSTCPGYRPSPTGSGWVTDDDYPLNANRMGLEGVAGYRLGVDEKGCTVKCEITLSTAFEELDLETCAVLRKRARFTPARAADGTDIPATFDGKLTWKLPEQPFRKAKPWTARATARFAANGTLLGCRSSGSGEAVAVAQFCRYAFLLDPGHVAKLRGAVAGPYSILFRGGARFDGSAPALEQDKGLLITKATIRFVIAPDGLVSSCPQPAEVVGLTDVCARFADRYRDLPLRKAGEPVGLSGGIALEYRFGRSD